MISKRHQVSPIVVFIFLLLSLSRIVKMLIFAQQNKHFFIFPETKKCTKMHIFVFWWHLSVCFVLFAVFVFIGMVYSAAVGTPFVAGPVNTTTADNCGTQSSAMLFTGTVHHPRPMAALPNAKRPRIHTGYAGIDGSNLVPFQSVQSSTPIQFVNGILFLYFS